MTQKLTKSTRGGARKSAGWKRAPDSMRLGRHIIKAGDRIRVETIENGNVSTPRMGHLAIELVNGEIEICAILDNGTKIIMRRGSMVA